MQELPFKRAAVEDLGKCQQAVRQCSAAGRHSRDVPDTGRLPRVAPEQDAPPGYVEMASDIYAVRKSMVNDILLRLKIAMPSVDAFGTREQHLCERWWGPGSRECEDAMQASWKEESLLWLNPPFCKLEAVTDKLLAEQARAVVICPHWPRRKYFQELQKVGVRKYIYPIGTKFFERTTSTVSGIKFPVWAILVDPAQKATDKRKVMSINWEDPDYKFPATISSKRRQRKKVKTTVLC